MTTASPHAGHAHVSRGNVRNAAMTSGIVLFVIEVSVGFIPASPSPTGMAFAGGSEAEFFNVFQVSVLLDLIYLGGRRGGLRSEPRRQWSREFLMEQACCTWRCVVA